MEKALLEACAAECKAGIQGLESYILYVPSSFSQPTSFILNSLKTTTHSPGDHGQVRELAEAVERLRETLIPRCSHMSPRMVLGTGWVWRELQG